MAVRTVAGIARLITVASCWALVLSLTLVSLDIATNEPGRWELIPRWADTPILLAPLVVAFGALVFTAIAALRREPEAYRLKTWLASCLIVVFYVIFFICAAVHPFRVY
jgi:hypothetical protein